MRQAIYPDRYDVETWDASGPRRVYLHIANSERWREITPDLRDAESDARDTVRLEPGRRGLPRDETFELALELAQTQKLSPKKGGGDVHSAATVPVQCTTTPRMWSGSMALTSGEFQPGAATAKAFTLNAEKWVAPAQASREVRLFRSK